jgi:hypothetical protein
MFILFIVMEIKYGQIENDNYIRENNYKKTCSIYLCCCQANFYENVNNYFQKFICYIF